jgi:cytidylate kinase
MDKKRKNSPLIKVQDAILIRTDRLSKIEVLNQMTKSIEKIIK